MESPKLSLKFWIRGKRPDEKKGIEVSEAFLEERCNFLDLKYQAQPIPILEEELFIEYSLKKSKLKLVRPSLNADKKPSYLIEIIGTEENIFELAEKNDLPYSKQELTKYP